MPISRRNALLGLTGGWAGCLATPVRGRAQPPRTASPPRYADAMMVGEFHTVFSEGRATLALKPGRRFSYVWVGCTGVQARRAGRWEWRGDVIALLPDPDASEGEPSPPPRLVPVAWGVRLYLVDEDRMPAFGGAIHGRSVSDDWKALHAWAFWRGPDPGVPFDGDPDIPERFREWYERGPVTATIVTVREDNSVTLAWAGETRLRVGLRLISEKWLSEVEVASVAGARATATRISDPRQGFLVPGDTLTSGNARI